MIYEYSVSSWTAILPIVCLQTDSRKSYCRDTERWEPDRFYMWMFILPLQDIWKNKTNNHSPQYGWKKDCKHRFFTMTVETFLYHVKHPYHTSLAFLGRELDHLILNNKQSLLTEWWQLVLICKNPKYIAEFPKSLVNNDRTSDELLVRCFFLVLFNLFSLFYAKFSFQVAYE